MKTLYARVQLKTGGTSFHRCAIKFTREWQEVVVDDATARRLQAEQMLEVSETRPAGFGEDATAGDSAAIDPAAGPVSDTPADATADAKARFAATIRDSLDAMKADGTAKPTDPLALAQAIRTAIAALPRDDAALWTAQGKARLEAIAFLTGWEVTAAERDAAQVEAEQP